MADTIYQNDDGIAMALAVALGKASTYTFSGSLRLFKNNLAVSKATVFANLTEATFTGYAAVALSQANFPAPSVAAHVASSLYGVAVTFTLSGGAAQTLYGWYITDAGNTKLLCCANFAAGPYVLTNPGDNITVAPTLTHQSLN